jgi:hypothetical protein
LFLFRNMHILCSIICLSIKALLVQPARLDLPA